jgi:hypothetical protein
MGDEAAAKPRPGESMAAADRRHHGLLSSLRQRVYEMREGAGLSPYPDVARRIRAAKGMGRKGGY